MIKVPAFFFPTKTVLVDDDSTYAKLFIDSLECGHSIEFLNDIDRLINQSEEDFIFTENRPINVEKLIENSINAPQENSAKIISVIVADLHMPNTTGIELFRKLKSPFIYRILISNFSRDGRFQDEINDAQNAGTIHAVLQKKESLRDELPKILAQGQQKFFTNLATRFYNNSIPVNCLYDTAFAGHFSQLIDEYNPDYIQPGKDFSYFTFKKKSKNEKMNLFVTTSDEIRTLLQGDTSRSALSKTIELLKTGDFMICHENPHMLEGEEWAFYLRPAQKINGSNTTYLTHVLET